MNLLAHLADWLSRYTRLTCPACPLIRYRGLDQAEETGLRIRMADHIHSHDTKGRG